MRILLQRVKKASVTVDGKLISSISTGLLLFLGICHGDDRSSAEWLADKISVLRIFSDENGKMNLSVKEAGGDILVVSQFTLYGDCRRGRRPAFDKAAPPALAEELYEYFMTYLTTKNLKVLAGVFGADMKVSLINDGPVTFILEHPEIKAANNVVET